MTSGATAQLPVVDDSTQALTVASDTAGEFGRGLPSADNPYNEWGGVAEDYENVFDPWDGQEEFPAAELFGGKTARRIERVLRVVRQLAAPLSGFFGLNLPEVWYPWEDLSTALRTLALLLLSYAAVCLYRRSRRPKIVLPSNWPRALMAEQSLRTAFWGLAMLAAGMYFCHWPAALAGVALCLRARVLGGREGRAKKSDIRQAMKQ